MIISTFFIVIMSILFGMYLGFRWARGENIYADLEGLIFKTKRFLRRLLQ